MSVSVVVPVYRSAPTLTELVHRISETLAGVHYEIVLVDDGSRDSSWQTVRELANQNAEVKAIRLGRNYGQHSALLAGVRHARFDITVTLDDDLQNPPEEIPLLLSVLHQSGADVVYGIPAVQAHARWRRIGSWAVRQSMKSVLGAEEAVNMSAFRAFKTNLREAFDVRLGPGISLDALLAWGTTAFTSVTVRHDERRAGRSNYTLRKLLNFTVDTVTGYSTVPLRVVSTLGYFTAVLGFFLMVFFVFIPFIRGLSVQGFPFLASTIILFAGIQLITLGVIGDYLGRMHFRIMEKPEYVVAEALVNGKAVESKMYGDAE